MLTQQLSQRLWLQLPLLLLPRQDLLHRAQLLKNFPVPGKKTRMHYLAETVGYPLLVWLIFVPACLLQNLVAAYRQEDHFLPAQVHCVRLFAAVRRSAARPSSAPSSNRSRSRSRTRPVMPCLSHDVVSTAAAPSATVLPAAAETNVRSISSIAATAVPVAAAANPYPVDPMFPDNSAGAASSLSSACNMASASCYPFVSQFASFTPAASMASQPAHVANACNVNFNQALTQPPASTAAEDTAESQPHWPSTPATTAP